MITTTYRTCPMCEANCGVAIEADPETETILSVKGDQSNVFSAGFVCPKSQAIAGLGRDPDRLTRPMRRVDGRFVEIGWKEAFDLAATKFAAIREAHGPDAIGIFRGNPAMHSAGYIYNGAIAGILGTRQYFSAASIDAWPRLLTNGVMYGDIGRYAIPDLERLSLFIILGGNPMVSNGSILTAPGMPRRLRAIQERGGRIVVIDPRRTETAKVADEHFAVRPTTDALFLFAMVHTLFEENLVSPGHVAPWLRNVEALREAAREWSPEVVAPLVDIEAGRIRELTRAFAASPGAALYGRVGACCQRFGSITSWLIEALNLLTGNIDREGGLLFPRPVLKDLFYSATYDGDQAPWGRYHSRVRGMAELMGQFPSVTMADEIDTEGDGRIRALLTIAGNPVRSIPDSNHVASALGKLDFMVSVDIYINETSRYADLILPPVDLIRQPNFTALFATLMIRSYAKYSPPVFPKREGEYYDWEIQAEIAARLTGQTVAEFNRSFLLQLVAQGKARVPELADETPESIYDQLGGDVGPEKLGDFLIRAGEFGDCFGRKPDGLTMDKLKTMPHGVEFGGLTAGLLGEVMHTPDGKIDMAPEMFVNDIPRMRAWCEDELKRIAQGDGALFMLTNRRDLRSQNSWLHNLTQLAKGPERSQLLMNPADAVRLGISDGGMAKVRSNRGEVSARVAISNDVRQGEVNLPHGWGHDDPHAKLSVASQRPGSNLNTLGDDRVIDVPSGNAVFNGLAVHITPLAGEADIAA